MVTLRNREARGRGYAVKKRAGHTSRKSLASTTMIVTGIWLLRLRRPPPEDVQVRAVVRDAGRHARPVRGWCSRSSPSRSTSSSTSSAWWSSACTCRHGLSSAFQSLGLEHPRYNGLIRGAGLAIAVADGARLRADPGRSSTSGGGRDARRQDSRRRHRRQVGPAPLRDEAGEPGQQAQVHDHRRRHRPRRRLGGGLARRAGLQRQGVLHPRHRRAARTASPPRAASTPPRTTTTTATASSGCSTTRSRAATTAPARPTSTAWPQLSVNIIDQCVAQGVPFAREYGGLLDNRSFGGAQVSRTFYARGQTGQQLLLGAYQSLMRQVEAGTVTLFPHREMLDLVRRRRQGARHHRAQPASPASSSATPPTPSCLAHRRLRHGLLPLDQRRELERHGGLALRTSAARSSPTRASRRSTRPASRCRATTSRSSR